MRMQIERDKEMMSKKFEKLQKSKDVTHKLPYITLIDEQSTFSIIRCKWWNVIIKILKNAKKEKI